MRKSRFSEEQILGVLKEAEGGVPVAELCRRLGVSDDTLYHWKAKYGGLEVNEARRVVAKVEFHAGELFPRVGVLRKKVIGIMLRLFPGGIHDLVRPRSTPS